MGQDRRALDASAFSLMLVLTAVWGFHQVAIKVTSPDVSLVMQAALRSVAAALLVLAWARLRGIDLFGRDGTLWPGIAAGVLFGLEFTFIYGGLGHTNASRMAVLVYLAPALTALGMHFLVPGERLRAVQWAGVLVAFSGIVLAFSEKAFSSEGSTFFGDLCAIAGAIFWAATTVLIRTTSLARASATKTLFYQLAVSAAVLPAASLLLGEPGIVRLSPLAIGSLAFQTLIVAFASYLAWFWLLTRYLATPLSVLSFMAPLFGVASGVLLLSEPLGARLAAAAVLVGAGIVLVNLRRG